MSDNINIEQKTALGSHDNTFIAEQHNYTGLSVVDATKMAFAMFREYYPQLRKEALEDLRKIIVDKLNNIPAEYIVPPKARIAVTALQNASITEEQEIRDMYANLLASSMNKIVKDGIHPGFVEIIKQLSPDEARVLHYMFFIRDIIPVVTLRYESDNGGGIDVVRNFSNIGEVVFCENPLDVNKYFDNLIRLGLLENGGVIGSLVNKKLYEPLKKHTFIQQLISAASKQKSEYNKVNIKEGYIFLTDYGKAFCEVCISK